MSKPIAASATAAVAAAVPLASQILAGADLAISLWETFDRMMDEARQRGEITAAEQQERRDRVHAIYGRVGVSPPPR